MQRRAETWLREEHVVSPPARLSHAGSDRDQVRNRVLRGALNGEKRYT